MHAACKQLLQISCRCSHGTKPSCSKPGLPLSWGTEVQHNRPKMDVRTRMRPSCGARRRAVSRRSEACSRRLACRTAFGCWSTVPRVSCPAYDRAKDKEPLAFCWELASTVPQSHVVSSLLRLITAPCRSLETPFKHSALTLDRNLHPTGARYRDHVRAEAY